MGTMRTQYRCIETTIATGSTDTSIDITAIAPGARTIFIANNTATALDLGVRLNDTANDLITIKAGRFLYTHRDEIQVDHIYLTNGSGNTVTYQIIATY